MISKIFSIVNYAKTLLTRFWRDKVALFFTFLFPLIFLFVFGSIFNNDKGVVFDIALINNSKSEVAKSFIDNIKASDNFRIHEGLELDGISEKMGRGELDSAIVFDKNFGKSKSELSGVSTKNQHDNLPTGNVDVYYLESNAESGKTIASVIDGFLQNLEQEITSQSPLFSVEMKSTKALELSQLDYTISGLLGFTIMSLAIFGLSNSMPSDKKTGVFRRIRATSFSINQLLIGTLLYYLVIGTLSIILVLSTAILVFDYQMNGNWLDLFIMIILGLICMIGFGLAIGGWAKNENQSAPLANLVAFPMMFLSGSFFPRFIMPDWLQALTNYIPLSPIVDAIRLISTEGKTLADVSAQIIIILAWTIIIYLVSVKVFRWE